MTEEMFLKAVEDGNLVSENKKKLKVTKKQGSSSGGGGKGGTINQTMSTNVVSVEEDKEFEVPKQRGNEVDHQLAPIPLVIM